MSPTTGSEPSHAHQAPISLGICVRLATADARSSVSTATGMPRNWRWRAQTNYAFRDGAHWVSGMGRALNYCPPWPSARQQRSLEVPPQRCHRSVRASPCAINRTAPKFRLIDIRQ